MQETSQLTEELNSISQDGLCSTEQDDTLITVTSRLIAAVRWSCGALWIDESCPVFNVSLNFKC